MHTSLAMKFGTGYRDTDRDSVGYWTHVTFLEVTWKLLSPEELCCIPLTNVHLSQERKWSSL